LAGNEIEIRLCSHALPALYSHQREIGFSWQIYENPEITLPIYLTPHKKHILYIYLTKISIYCIYKKKQYNERKYLHYQGGIIMKKKIIAISCLATLLAFGSDVMADGTANATAKMAGGLSITKDGTTSTSGDLAFGTVVPNAIGGTVVINPFGSGARTATGVQVISSTYGPAAFTISGESNATYAVTLPSTTTITKTGGTETMTVDTFTSTLSGIGLVVTGRLVGTEGSFTVGGKLHVAPDQLPGSYTGTFTVTAAYN
jgi:hypothetical protein